MANVLNYHSGEVLRSTTSVNLPIPFTPTSGSRLVAYIDCSSTFTMGGSWTKHLTAVGALERAVATMVSAGGETSIPVTLAVARTVAYTVIELRGGGTLSPGAGISDASNQSGLPASSDNTLMFGLSTTALNSTPVGSSTWTGTPAFTEAADRLTVAQGGDNDDAVYQTVAFQEGEVTSMTASRAWATGPSGLNTPIGGFILGYWNTPGGGGSNTPPTANAGTDQTVTVGATVTLNGSGSSDSDGTITGYTWTQISGTSVTLSGTGANRTFSAASAGTYVFGLTVTDDDGATSSQDTVTITVNPSGGGNNPPSANAGADQSVETGTLVTLSGSGSDSDGTIASYSWAQTGGTTVSLSGSGANRTFTPSAAGTYTFQLTVTDDDGASASDTVVITVTAPGSSVETIAQENAKTAGRFPPSYWFQGLSSLDLPSFPRSTYYLPGQTAQFSVNFNNPFNVRIFRLGHYGGDGAREVATPFAGTPTAQPAPTTIPNGNGAISCANWSVNASWSIPVDAQPGWYMAYFDGPDVQHGHALFCVSDRNNKKPTLIVASDATWHAAYNGYGGNNVYGADLAIGLASDRAFCSTYDKPVITINYVPQTHFFNNTYPYLKWSESVGIDAGVTTIEQIKNDPTILDGRDVIVWTGHNEYVPQTVVNKVKALLTYGQNMVNIAGNDFFWRVKFTNGSFSSTTNGRVMWCKKDSLAGPTTGPDAAPSHAAGTPFTTDEDWTGTWQDTRWALREPSYEYLGDQFVANGIRNDAVTVPMLMKTLPPWRDCPGIQAMTSTGQSYSFAAGTLGMEWDEPHPSTELEYVNFSSTDILLSAAAADEDGAVYNVTKTGQHRFMMMKSGNSYVANFNSDQWGWALDSVHLRGSTASDANARQMMLNVLYDLGAVGNGTNITSTGLVIPTPVDIATGYGLPAVDPVDPPPGGGSGGVLTVTDTPTLNLTLTGDGSAENPYVLSGVASPELGYSQSTRMFYSDGTQWHEL